MGVCSASSPRCRLLYAAIVLICSALAVIAGGCGYRVETTTASADPPDATAASAPAPPTSVKVSEETTAASFLAVLQAMALAMAPLPVYGFEELPAGASLPADWWPVIELPDPAGYDGERFPNPRIMGEGSEEPQAQLVLKIEGGWLLLFENLRGDLGDVQGDSVGTIAGHPATLYEVNGGSLVQWSDHGRWYGVFGREVPADRVVEIALGAEPVIPE